MTAEVRITFGQRFRDDTHKTFPDAHPDGWVTIVADNANQAREAAFRLLGTEWAFDYDMGAPSSQKYDWASTYPRGELGRFDVTV